LHQVAVIEPDGRNPALGRGIDDVRGAGAQADAVDHVPQAGDGCLDIVSPVLDGRHQQFARRFQRCTADLFLPGAEGDLVDAGFRGFTRLAEASRHARQALQLQHDMFQDVRSPCAFSQPLQETAAFADAAAMLDQGRKPGRQPFIQAGYGIGWKFFKRADIDPGFDDWPVGPDIGAAQMRHAAKYDVFRFHHCLILRRAARRHAR
jgi:hypothetical protein